MSVLKCKAAPRCGLSVQQAGRVRNHLKHDHNRAKVALIKLLLAKQCTVILEQPQGSLLEKHDAFQRRPIYRLQLLVCTQLMCCVPAAAA